MPDLVQLHAAGVNAVRAREHETDGPPSEGGRWGLSLVMQPEGALADALSNTTQMLLVVAGKHHFATGRAGALHVSVRALQRFQRHRDQDREAALQSAIRTAIKGVPPLRLTFNGLGLTPLSVHASAIDVDGTGRKLRECLDASLTDDLESRWRRDPIWYSSLVHFAGPIAAPEELIGFVERRRWLNFGETLMHRLQLWRWMYHDRRMVPEKIAELRLGE